MSSLTIYAELTMQLTLFLMIFLFEAVNPCKILKKSCNFTENKISERSKIVVKIADMYFGVKWVGMAVVNPRKLP